MEKQNMVDMAKGGWKPTPNKVLRGKPMPTNHTNLEILSLDHVKMG